MSTTQNRQESPFSSSNELRQLATLSATKLALSHIPSPDIYQGVAQMIEHLISLPLAALGIEKIPRLRLRASNRQWFEICMMPGAAQKIVVMMESERQALGIREADVHPLS